MALSKRELIKLVYEEYTEMDKWMSSVPREINEAFYDNPYVYRQSKIIHELMMRVFSMDELGWVDWLTFDWREDNTLTIFVDDIEYEFSELDHALNKFFDLDLIRE